MKNYIYYIIALATLLRLISINQSLWLDEATTAIVARDLGINGLFESFISKDFHPPLYYILVTLWSLVFGVSEIGLRIPSVIAGITTVFFVYKITKLLLNEESALISSLFMATAPLHIYYSQEARMYAATTLFVTMMVYYYLKIIKKPEKNDWLFFGVSSSALLLTDYLPILIFPTIWTHFLLNKKGTKKINVLLKAHALPLVSALAISPIFLTQLKNGLNTKMTAGNWWSILGATNIKNILLVPVKFAIGRTSFDNNYIYAFFVLAVLSIFAFIIYQNIDKKLRKNKENFFLFWLSVPVILGAIIGLFLPVFSYFRFLFALPALYILLAKGLMNTKTSLFLPLLLAVIFINLGFSWRYLSNAQFHRENWRSAVSYTQKTQDPAILFPSNSQKEAVTYYNKDANFVSKNELRQAPETIYYFKYVEDIFDPEKTTAKRLSSENYSIANELDFNGVVVVEYKKQ